MNQALDYLWQIVLASGIIGTIITLVTSKLINRRFDSLDDKKKTQDKLDILLLQKIDKLAEFVEVMAQRLHDAGIINGDLERLRSSYAQVDKEYDDYLRELVVKERK